MGSSIRRVGGVVAAAILLTGLVSTSAAATQDHSALQDAMNELAASGAAGVQVHVHDQQDDWMGRAGVRELGRDGKVPTNGRFRVGSITKTFVSTVMLQLVGEGKVRLDDPADRYLPRFGLDQRITVRMLLQHTSGIFNYTGEANPDGTVEPGIPLDGQEFVDNRFRTYPPAELVQVALAKPARFAPGTSWSYSNTNYVLAGLLIETVTGTPYAIQVQHRILTPLGLWETMLPGTWPGIPGAHAHGYYAYEHENEQQVVDITRLSPTWAYAAGEIISTAKDLDRFISALLGGKLLAPELLAEMLAVRPIGDGSGYGLGLMSIEAGPGCGGTLLGHTGGIHGYGSYLFSNIDLSKRVEMSVTIGAVDMEDPVAGERFANAMNKVVATALCGTTEPALNAQNQKSSTH